MAAGPALGTPRRTCSDHRSAPATSASAGHVRAACVELSAFLEATRRRRPRSDDCCGRTHGPVRRRPVRRRNGRASRAGTGRPRQEHESHHHSRTLAPDPVQRWPEVILREAMDDRGADRARTGPWVHRRACRPAARPSSPAAPALRRRRRSGLGRPETTCRCSPTLRPVRPRVAGDLGGDRLHRPPRPAKSSKLRLECIGRYNGCRCSGTTRPRSATTTRPSASPRRLHQGPPNASDKTLSGFEDRHGRPATPPNEQRWRCSPPGIRNPAGRGSIVIHLASRPASADWVDALDLGHYVPHQARHTLATRLLRARRRPAPHQEVPGPRLDRHGRALRRGRLSRDRRRPAARLGRRPRRPHTPANCCPRRTPDEPAAGRGAGPGPVPPQHPGRRRLLHLPARRRRRAPAPGS